jgi:hypothetical protein
MKLTGNTELLVVAVLVGLISFMPRMLSVLVSSQIGKAAAFAFVAWMWKQHNELVALLLAVALVKASPSYEGIDATLDKKDSKKEGPKDGPKPSGGM